MCNKKISKEVILGVDTHLDVHVGAVIDKTGKLLGTKSISATNTGYSNLYNWTKTFGEIQSAGIEGTGSYGAELYKFLNKNGVLVYEVNRPDRASRRQQGKSDTTDAISAANSVLSGKSKAIPKHKTGACEAMRVASVARRSAIKDKTQAINQIRSLLVSAPQDIREKLWKTNPKDCVRNCIRVKTLGDTLIRQTLFTTLKLLGKRWMILAKEVDDLDNLLDSLTMKYAKNLRSQFGVGPLTAATLLSVAGDNPHRLVKESALASLCGTNPLPASSGKTIRHRLNRGGCRVANNALWTITMVRMRSDPRTRLYVERRTTEGLTNKEIQRCLKRYIIRELYPIILKDLDAIHLTS